MTEGLPDAWLWYMQRHANAAEVEGKTITLEVSGRPGIDLGSAPNDADVILTDVGATAEAVDFRIPYSEPPRSITVRAGEKLRTVEFSTHRSEIQNVTLELAEASTNVEVRLRAAVLRVAGGSCVVNAPVPPQQIYLQSTAFQMVTASRTGVKSMTLRGEVAIALDVPVESVLMVGRVTLHNRGPSKFDELKAKGKPSLTLDGQPLSVGSLPESCHVTLANARIEVGHATSTLLRPGSDGVVFSGQGSIEILGILHQPRFESEDPHLSVEVSGQLIDAEGPIVLHAEPTAIVQGKPDGQLEIGAVTAAQGAELEHVNIYALKAADLTHLQEATRLVPWIPRPKKARPLEDGMRLAGGNEESVLNQRAYFWTRLSTILKTVHAPGATQSEVRFAAARARRKSLKRGRERILLFLYSIVGYGERILLPLFLHVAISLCVAAVLSVLAGREIDLSLRGAAAFLETWVRVVLAPLAFFRVFGRPEVTGLAETLILAISQVLGVVLLFFTLAAIRRVAKAE